MEIITLQNYSEKLNAAFPMYPSLQSGDKNNNFSHFCKLDLDDVKNMIIDVVSLDISGQNSAELKLTIEVTNDNQNYGSL